LKARSLGQNLPRAKQMNRSLVLEQMLFHGPMNRQTIAQNLGLTSATITNFTGKLIREGLVHEVGYVEEERLGRRSVTIDLRNDLYVVMAIHLRATDLEIGFVGLRGAVSKRRLISYPKGLTKLTFLQFIKDHIRTQFALRESLDVVAIGVGSRALPLRVTDDQVVVSTDHHLHTIGLKQEISQYVDVPVFLQSNAPGMAMAERMYGHCRHIENFLLIYMGPKGIGSGLILHGELCKGTGISTLGFGHMLYQDGGRPCLCGRKGCLELYASESAILEACQLSSIKALSEKVKSGDEGAQRVLEQSAHAMASVLLSFLSMVDLHRVILGGTLASPAYPLVSTLQTHLQKNAGILDDGSVEVSVSALGSDLGIVGAAAPAIFEYIIRGSELPEIRG